MSSTIGCTPVKSTPSLITSSSSPAKNGAAIAPRPAAPPNNLSALNGFALSPPTLNTFPIWPKNPSPLLNPYRMPLPKPAPGILDKAPPKSLLPDENTTLLPVTSIEPLNLWISSFVSPNWDEPDE